MDPHPEPWRSATATIQRGLAPAGMDLAAPFQIEQYNQRVPPGHALAIPPGGSPRSLGVLVGNTRAIWSPFRAELRADPSLLNRPHPLDRHVERTMGRSLELLAHLHPVVSWGHTSPARISMQRAAVAAGLCFLSPAGLCIHPVFGLWIAIRAVVVLPVAGPPPPPASEAPCASCPRPCVPLLEQAMAHTDADADGSPVGIRHVWERWLAVRDACPVGREHRYSEEQIRYHYALDRAALVAGDRGR